MQELRRAADTVYSLHYHFVFTTKYRKPVLIGEIGHSVRDLIREICRSEDIEILQGHVRSRKWWRGAELNCRHYDFQSARPGNAKLEKVE